MYMIRPWLFTGSTREKIDADRLAEQQIDAVLHLHRPLDLPGVRSLYLRVEEGYPIQKKLFDQAAEFVRSQQGRLLVACGAGISRSTTFAVLALKERELLSLTAALQAVREAHLEAMPDQVHWESLRQFYQEGPPFWEIWKEAEF